MTFRHSTRAVSPWSGHTRAQLRLSRDSRLAHTRSRYNGLRSQTSEDVSKELVWKSSTLKNIDRKDEKSDEHLVRTRDHFWNEAAESRDTLIPGCFSRTRPGLPVHHVRPLVDFSSKRKPVVQATLDLVRRIRPIRLSCLRISLGP